MLLLAWAAPDVAGAVLCKTRRPARQLTMRPEAGVTVASARGFPFLVHGFFGSDALLAEIRDAADAAWQAEIVERGWAAPLADYGGPDESLDIYIDPYLGVDEAYTEAEDFEPSTPMRDATCFIGLPPSFSSATVLASTVAHELNHASHYAIDAVEDDAFWEHTAVLVEQQVVGEVSGYGVGIADYQGNPGRALDYIFDDYYEYGAALWLMFLCEAVGDGDDALARLLWEESAQPSGSNEPDFLDALPGILSARGWTLRRFFATFAAWRYFTGPRDDGAHFAAGAEWGASSLAPVEARRLDASGLALAGDLGAYGARLFEVQLATDRISGRVEGPEAAAAVVPLTASGAAAAEPQILESAYAEIALPPDTTRLLVALTRVPLAYDPDDDDWSSAPMIARFRDPSGDGGDDGDPEPGCPGCSAAPSSLALLAIAALWTRRRRRR